MWILGLLSQKVANFPILHSSSNIFDQTLKFKPTVQTLSTSSQPYKAKMLKLFHYPNIYAHDCSSTMAARLDSDIPGPVR